MECLPGDIPENIDVDISELRIHDHVRVQDLVPTGDYRYLDPPETLVVNIAPPRLVEEPTAPEAEGEAEPEVITKGKAEETEGESESKDQE